MGKTKDGGNHRAKPRCDTTEWGGGAKECSTSARKLAQAKEGSRGEGGRSSRNPEMGKKRTTPKVDVKKMEMGREAYGHVSRAKKLWGIMQKPEYARDEDGLGDLMTKEVLIYEAHGKVFADGAYLTGNFRSAQEKSRDARTLRILHQEIPKRQTALGEYHQAYRAYSNARRQQRREGRLLEQKMKLSDHEAKNREMGKLEHRKGGGNRPRPVDKREMVGSPISGGAVASGIIRLKALRAAGMDIKHRAWATGRPQTTIADAPPEEVWMFARIDKP